MDWVIVLLAANAVLLVANTVFFLACRGIFRRLIVLDKLLMRICVDAFARVNQPVWQAWTGAMGSISVNVSGIRWPWDHESANGREGE